MIDFAAARRMMVDCQVRPMDVTDLRVLEAMLAVPRERFVAPERAALAYADLDLPVDNDGSRRMLKPMVLAKLVQAVGIEGQDRVLDVGCCGGYSAAVLARLAGSVVALEQDENLGALARTALAGVGAANVSVVNGPLTGGWPQAAPYDAIVLEGATEVPPETLCRQLKDGGRLVCVLGRSPAGKAMVYRRVGDDVSGWPVFDAAAPLLPGFARKPEFVF
jgi:protein-L-isoaspartate(D-aspartate) O-methyltransferase